MTFAAGGSRPAIGLVPAGKLRVSAASVSARFSQGCRMPQPLWSASLVEARDVASLLPYARNARRAKISLRPRAEVKPPFSVWR